MRLWERWDFVYRSQFLLGHSWCMLKLCSTGISSFMRGWRFVWITKQLTRIWLCFFCLLESRNIDEKSSVGSKKCRCQCCPCDFVGGDVMKFRWYLYVCVISSIWQKDDLCWQLAIFDKDSSHPWNFETCRCLNEKAKRLRTKKASGIHQTMQFLPMKWRGLEGVLGGKDGF